MKKFILSLIIILPIICIAQKDIPFANPSFEGKPMKGVMEFGMYSPLLKEWKDCGVYEFPLETPYDLHPNNYWEVSKSAQDGNTYVGLVVRDNESWESISQKLTHPVLKDVCYSFSYNASVSRNYWSPTREELDKEINYTTPCILSFFAGDEICSTKYYLGSSPLITNNGWMTFEISFSVPENCQFFYIGADYEFEDSKAYNGHVLIDNLSNLTVVPCEEK